MVDGEYDGEFGEEEREEERGQWSPYPVQERKDSQLSFLRDVWREGKESLRLAKIANFTEDEAGRTRVPALTYLNVGLYAETEGFSHVRDFLRGHVVNVASVSLGRKAKFLDATFTQRRESKLITPKRQVKTRSILGSEKVETQGGEDQ